MPAICLALGLFIILNWLCVLAEPHFLRAARYTFIPSAAQIIVLRDAPRADVVFMGSSRALFGLDPSTTEEELANAGLRADVINLGFVTGAIDLNYLVLKNELRGERAPRVIVYGLSEFEFLGLDTPGGLLQADSVAHLSYLPLLLDWDDFSDLGGATLDAKLAFVANQLLPLYRDGQLIRDGLSIMFNPEDPAHRWYAPGPDHQELRADGFRTFQPEWSLPAAEQTAFREQMSRALHDVTLTPARLQLLSDFVSLAQSRGIRVVLVDMPVTPTYLGLWGNRSRIAEYEQAVRAIADERGVPLLELYENAEHVVPPDGFFDDHHLNTNGARALTAHLARTYLTSELQRAQ